MRQHFHFPIFPDRMRYFLVFGADLSIIEVNLFLFSIFSRFTLWYNIGLTLVKFDFVSGFFALYRTHRHCYQLSHGYMDHWNFTRSGKLIETDTHNHPNHYRPLPPRQTHRADSCDRPSPHHQRRPLPPARRA